VGDGASPAATAGVPTPASGPGTPLPERIRLVLVSTSGGESIIIYLFNYLFNYYLYVMYFQLRQQQLRVLWHDVERF